MKGYVLINRREHIYIYMDTFRGFDIVLALSWGRPNHTRLPRHDKNSCRFFFQLSCAATVPPCPVLFFCLFFYRRTPDQLLLEMDVQVMNGTWDATTHTCSYYPQAVLAARGVVKG